MESISKHIWCLCKKDPEMTWEELRKVLVGWFTNERTATEAICGLMRLEQMRETSMDLRERLNRLAALAYLNELLRTGMGVIQAQLADIFMDTLHDEDVQSNVLQSTPSRL